MEAERRTLGVGKSLPVATGRFEQAVSPDDIGLDELARPVDGTVDMRLRCQVHDRVGSEARQHLAHRGLIDDVLLHELVASVGDYALQRFEVACVGQFVEVQYVMIGVVDQMADQRRTDKAGATGDKYSHG
jgi:hypothetical protein